MKLKKSAVVLLVALPLAIWVSSLQVAEAKRGGFGHVGTHLLTGPGFTAISTANADGVFTASVFAFLQPPPGDGTPAYGTWTQTGPFSVRAVSLRLVIRNVPPDDLDALTWEKITVDLVSADGFATSDLTTRQEWFLVSDDPLDPDAAPVIGPSFNSGTSRRMDLGNLSGNNTP